MKATSNSSSANPKHFAEIAFILDRSGSMDSMKEAAISGFNAFLKEQQAEPTPARFSLVLFDNEYDRIVNRFNIREVEGLDTTTFVPRGSTALLDAIGRTIVGLRKQIGEAPEEFRPGKVILAILTDGQENSSVEYNLQMVNNLISEARRDDWDIFFLGANQDAIATATQMGIDHRNSASFAASDGGYRNSSRSISEKLRSKRRIFAQTASLEDLLIDQMDLSETYKKNEEDSGL